MDEIKYDPNLSWEDNICLAETAEFTPAKPYVRGDLKPYKSPITGKTIEGRSARREDLARNNCREVDPSEYEPVYKNYAFCQKHRKPFMGGDVPPPMTRDEKAERKEIRTKIKADEKAVEAVRAKEAAKSADPDLARFARGNPYTQTLAPKLKAVRSNAIDSGL